MKRKNEKVPGFDEIIFENRNKEYGAYDLRKSYNRTTSISILSGVAIVAIIMTAFSLADSKDIPQQDKPIVIIQMSDIIKPDPVKPAENPQLLSFLQPEERREVLGIDHDLRDCIGEPPLPGGVAFYLVE